MIQTSITRSILSTLILAAALSTSALAQWSSNAAANLAVGDLLGDQAVPKIAASGDGSTWIAWFDNAGGSYTVRAQRLDSAGVETFAHNGIVVSNQPQSTSLVDWDLISDGAGGCVVTFTDTRAGSDLDVYAYRIDATGTELWGANGVTLSNNADFEANPRVVLTTDGSFVFAWSRTPSTGSGSIRLQKLDAAGNPQYVADGIAISGPGSEKPGFSTIVASDNGSYIVAWVRDIGSFSSPRHLRTQKFDASGNALWNGGAPVVIYDTLSLPIAYQPELRSDGQGGGVYAWHRASGSVYDSFVQRVDTTGTELFAHEGITVSTDGTYMKLSPSPAYLSASGDVVVLFEKRNVAQSMWGLSAQRISPAGVRLWTDPGRDLLAVDATVKSIERCVPFGDGALAFCFLQPNMASQNSELIGMRLDASGTSTWTPSPLLASSYLSPKDHLGVAIDGTAVARLAWRDGRTDSGDIYAQNVACDGTLGNTSTCVATPYCIGAPNSVGPGAVLGLSGSACLALNDFTLACLGLPPNTIGLFFYGLNAIQAPFGDGYRCVNGTIIRLGPPQHANAQGNATRYVDLTAPPANSGPGAITAGSTKRFQFWYRNVGGPLGTGFNLSNGLAATFCP